MELRKEVKALFDEAFLCNDVDMLVFASALTLMVVAYREGKLKKEYDYEPKEERKELGKWKITVERIGYPA